LRLVVGLGNPGEEYAGTRHNAGFMVVEALAAAAADGWRADPDCQGLLAETVVAGAPVVLLKPQTYMNRSGQAVAAVHRRLACSPEEVLVVLDDFLLEFGRLRFRRAGSDGGHHGLASVLTELGTTQVPRLRLGIGAPPPGGDPIDHVLERFGTEEPVAELVARAAEAVGFCARDGMDAAMNRYNGS
jgi:PTH1 family peptidyl-tRNA hydrolase